MPTDAGDLVPSEWNNSVSMWTRWRHRCTDAPFLISALVGSIALAGCQAEVPGGYQGGMDGATGQQSGTGGNGTTAAGAVTGTNGSTTGTQVGGVGGGASTGTSSSTTGGGGGLGAPVCSETPPAPRAPLRRITRFEYNNTVRDLLGITSEPANDLPGEELGSGFGNDADALGVSRLLIDGYRSVAQQIAEQVTADSSALVGVTGCDPTTTGEDACRQQFLDRYLARAFRRPPTAEDLTAYQAAFTEGQTLGGDFASGVRAVVERSLQSAQFLYRIEVGKPLDESRNLAQPTDYEMATRLSYLIWGSMPDEVLLDAAAQGSLSTKEGVLTQATRMMEDDRAKDGLRFFHGQLFGINGLDHLERDAEYYPTFQPGMGELFRRETEAFLDHVIWQGSGNLASIFTAPYTFVNEPLAKFYGIPNVTGDAFQRVNVDPTQRAGLLTQASILTVTTPGSRTDPVVRGKWLYTKILCGHVDDPPPDVPKLPDPVPGQSVRERLEMHRSAAVCRGCHIYMDPMGLAFEHFDGVGLWRDTDNDAPIDDSGEIPTTDVAGPFNGALEFAAKVAQSSDVRRCYADRYMTYAYGRAMTEDDNCSRASVGTAFDQAQGDIRELMLAVTQSDAFLQRPLNPTQ